jgi:hypothetical protein
MRDRQPGAAAVAALVPAVVAALAAVALTGGSVACRRGAGGGAAPSPGEPAAAAAPRPALPVDLYFPGDGGLLYPERRELAVPDDAETQIRALLAELLAGPRTPGLLRPLPAGVEVDAVHLGGDGTAFVDLVAPAAAEPPAAGSGLEMQIVYSVVNTVALNVPQARRVALLWNGAQRPTFAGHLDTSRPLAPAPGLVAR